MKRVCVEGKSGESVCAKGQWPLGSVENATCWECLRRCIKSEQDFSRLLEEEIARLRGAICAFHDSFQRYPNYEDEYEAALGRLFEIAREG